MVGWLIGYVIGIAYVAYEGIISPLIGMSMLLANLLFWKLASTNIKNVALLVLAVSFGIFWHSLFAIHKIAWNLPNHFINKTVQVTGEIISMPKHEMLGDRFQFQLQTINHQSATARIRLTWIGQHPALLIGDQWKLFVRLKPDHGLSNPGGFDYVLWLVSHNIRATGYVVAKKNYHKINSNHWSHTIDKIRQKIQSAIVIAIPNQNLAAIITALTIGSRAGLSQTVWQVFQNTGTSHLVAISGLHIGLLATACYLLFSNLWKLFPGLLFFYPAQQVGCIAAIVSSLLYALLAGFSLPTQRAFIMITTFMLARLCYRQVALYYRFALAFFIILLFDPLAIFLASFWLSFSAVFWIQYGMLDLRQPQSKIKQYFKLQWILFLSLIPLSLFYFQRFSLVMIVANLIAIPWIGMLVVPFSVFSCCVWALNASLGKILFYYCAQLLKPIWIYLRWLSQPSWVNFIHAVPNRWVLYAAIVATLIYFAPKGFPGRWLAVIWALPLFLYRLPSPAKSSFWVTVLDVGQGLSVVVRTAHHTLLYDTGPGHDPGFNAGRSVIIPYLRLEGIDRIDAMVISHGDNDHIGGANAVLQAIPTDQIMTSVPERLLNFHAKSCHQGQHWDWDGVHFQMLYPKQNQPYQDNNSSCVLRISNSKAALLLTGDIEKQAEQYLLSADLNLKSTVMVAPHHGSKTSSTRSFLQSVKPLDVVFSTGYYNRYHFPSKSVVKNYQNIGSCLYNTASRGAIIIRILQNGQVRLVSENTHTYYWQHKGISLS